MSTPTPLPTGPDADTRTLALQLLNLMNDWLGKLPSPDAKALAQEVMALAAETLAGPREERTARVTVAEAAAKGLHEYLEARMQDGDCDPEVARAWDIIAEHLELPRSWGLL